MNFTPEQQELIDQAIESKIFLHGRAGTGKSSAVIGRIEKLLSSDIPIESILLITPQRSYQLAILQQLENSRNKYGVLPTATVGGLARRLISLFWPLIGELSGFVDPQKAPTFLTLETAQYHLMSILAPALEQGAFKRVIVDRNRLSSQILDNLNKSAMINVDHRVIGERLASAWSGDPNYLQVYQDAQASIDQFRQKCLAENLLDHSLQIEILNKVIWPNPLVRDYLLQTYQHLIYENCEEDFPVAHQIVSEWISLSESAVVVKDDESGYRKFLGADPISADLLALNCRTKVEYTQPIHRSPLENFEPALKNVLLKRRAADLEAQERKDLKQRLVPISAKYYPEMIDDVCDKISELIAGGSTTANEIAVLSPFLNDTIWFPIQSKLASKGIQVAVKRPSRSLADEPIVNCLVTLAQIAHPAWGAKPSVNDFTTCLFQIIDGIDLVRSKLLSEIVYRSNLNLTSFKQINPEMQKRVTPQFGSSYDTLREWLVDYRNHSPLALDHFFRKLFGEILSQPGYKLQTPSTATQTVYKLVESAQKFRSASNYASAEANADLNLGKEYIALLTSGVIAAHYEETEQNTDSVVISPAFTYLLSGERRKVQFWLDAGSSGWFERIDQPLTHPYVLSLNWPPNKKWTDEDEYEANLLTMYNLLKGLVNNGAEKIFVGYSQFNESGYEQKGQMIQAIQRLG